MAEMPIIDDNNFRNFVNDNDGARGYDGMWQDPGFSAPGFADLESVPLVAESEWDDRIRQKQKDQTELRTLCLDSGLEVLNQGQTNFCWINAPTFCCMVNRLKETGRTIRYSPASAGAPIKNFRNVGGWGSEGLNYLIKNGLNTQADWPANAIDRRYYTPENREKAKKNIVLEYYRLDSWAEVGSCLIAGVPVAGGFDWWRHEVTLMDLTLGAHDTVIANSWGNWGDRGYGKLSGQKKMPDDAVAITSMTAI